MVLLSNMSLTLLFSQDEHIKGLSTLPNTHVHRDLFHTVRGNILLISQRTFPDIYYDDSQLCQVKAEEISLKTAVHSTKQ